MINVISWNNGESARAISSLVSNGKLLLKNGAPIPRSSQGVINFGCSELQRGNPRGVALLNEPAAVAIACSKLRTFNTMASHTAASSYTPWFTTDPDQAVLKSIMDDTPIVCRTIDNGHSGAGIIVKTPAELQADGSLPRASVYVKAIKKRREYRVHCGMFRASIRGDRSQFRVIDVQRKVRRAGVPDGGVNGTDRPFIWNHGNDFVFQREGVSFSTIPNLVIMAAQHAIRALGLDFAAIDVVVEQQTGNVYVLEVNTSPGMEGTTLERYAEYFRARLGSGNQAEFSQWYGYSSVEIQDGSED